MATAKRTAKSKGKSRSAKPAQKVAIKKLPAIKSPLKKGGVVTAIYDLTCVSKRDVTAVLEGFTTVLEHHVKPNGPGVFTLPGYFKVSVVKKPARPARKGINPFTGEEIMIKAKPARKVVKIKALKKLKEMVD